MLLCPTDAQYNCNNNICLLQQSGQFCSCRLRYNKFPEDGISSLTNFNAQFFIH